jgi:glycosyltransferase involved in cell wall biosynthesis
MKRAKIALNGRFSGTLQPTGTQTVAFHLFDSIVKSAREFNLVIFADPAFKGVSEWADYPRTEIRVVPFALWSRMKSQLWEQIVLPLEVKKNRLDLVHHPIMTCPRWSLGARTVVTLHDLTFYHHPEWLASKFRRWLMTTAVPGMRKASHVVAISDYVLADARKTLRLPADRTSRIYNGIGKFDSALPNTGRSGSVILGVNLWQPHKNLPRLLEAFKILRTKIPTAELHLAGRPQAQYRNSPELSGQLEQPGVRVLGYLSHPDLARAYAGATVVCYPSLEEGFGLPILEAMASGTPVVTSNASCLPEIAGGAAILVDPNSPPEIARGLQKALMEDSAERELRIEAGKKVAARFTWSQAAKQYIELYERLLA